MPEITDPALLAQLTASGSTGGDARSTLTRPETMTREAAMARNNELRQFMQMNMEAENFNRVLPSGRFQANVNAGVQEFPPSWQSNPKAIADFQSFQGLQQRMLKPSMGIVGSKQPGSSEMNTPRELEMQERVVPGPSKEAGANRYLNESLFKQAQMQLARNAFAQRWRDANGSIHSKDKAGRIMEEAFSDHMTRGTGKAWADKTAAQYLDESIKKRGMIGTRGAPKKPAVVDFNDL